MLLSFDMTQDCAYSCSKQFEKLSQEGSAQEKSTAHIVIDGDNDATQVEIYVLSKDPDKVKVINNK